MSNLAMKSPESLNFLFYFYSVYQNANDIMTLRYLLCTHRICVFYIKLNLKKYARLFVCIVNDANNNQCMEMTRKIKFVDLINRREFTNKNVGLFTGKTRKHTI